MKKILLGTAVIVLLAIGGGAWWLYGSLDQRVASAIHKYGSEITYEYTAGEAVKQIMGAVTQSATRAVSNLNFGGATETLKKGAGDKIKGLFK